MSSSEISTSPAKAKWPRRHPTSRGARKRTRELKRLGVLENHHRRKARLEHAAWLARHPQPEPKKHQDPPPRNDLLPPEPRRGGSSMQRLWVKSLAQAKGPQNLCPVSGCGYLHPGGYETVYDQGTVSHVQVRRCSGCDTLYRDFEAVVFADLHSADSEWNDCPHCIGTCNGGKEARVTVETSDAGRQSLCQCNQKGHYYKPYVVPVRRSSWWSQ